MRLGMLVDTKRCIGCDTCAVACKTENNLPDGVWWNRVWTVGGADRDTPTGTFPNLEMLFLTVACQHCENPPCVPVCPSSSRSGSNEGRAGGDLTAFPPRKAPAGHFLVPCFLVTSCPRAMAAAGGPSSPSLCPPRAGLPHFQLSKTVPPSRRIFIGGHPLPPSPHPPGSCRSTGGRSLISPASPSHAPPPPPDGREWRPLHQIHPQRHPPP